MLKELAKTAFAIAWMCFWLAIFALMVRVFWAAITFGWGLL